MYRLAIALASFGLAIIVAIITRQSATAVWVLSTAIVVPFLILYFRAVSASCGKSIALILSVVTVVLAIGLLPRQSPVFDVNPGVSEWILYALGLSATAAGAAYASRSFILPRVSESGGRSKRLSSILDVSPRRPRLLFGAFCAAIGVAVLNSITGDLAVFTSDINAARFTGNYGSLGFLWPIALPVLQVAVIWAALRAWIRVFDSWTILGILSTVLLILTGGRSLVGIAVLAVIIILIELRELKIWVGAISIAIGLLAFAAAGRIRTAGSSIADESATYLGRRDMNNLLGSLDIAFQAGPRVLWRVLAESDSPLGGRFLVGDLASFLRFSVPASDRQITQMIGQDPSVVGGLPPTIFGGFYLDFGWLGLVLMGILTGMALALSRNSLCRADGPGRLVWFGYFAGYVAISCYSYISLRPSWIIVGLLCASAIGSSGQVKVHARSDDIEVR